MGGLGAIALCLAGMVYQDHQIHHFHLLFNAEHDNFTKEHQLVVGMTNRQNTQTAATEKVVTKVTQGPETVKTVVKEIHDAPVPADCHKAPEFPQDVKDSY